MSRTTETNRRTIEPTSEPINLLSTSAARTYTHVHPVLLSAYFYIQFPTLVTSPVSTLLWDLLPLSFLQITYAITCLPPTKSIGSNSSVPAKAPSALKPKASKPAAYNRATPAQKSWHDLPNKITVCFLILRTCENLTCTIAVPLGPRSK